MKKHIEKKNLFLTITSLAILASLIGYVSYAIIAMGITESEFDIFAETTNGIVFTATGGDTFESEVLSGSMEHTNTATVVTSTSNDVSVTLGSDALKELCCTYKMYWVWEETEIVRNQYKLSPGATTEYVIEGSYTISYKDMDTGTKVLVTTNSNAFSKQLPDYDAEDNEIYTGTICNKNSNVLSDEIYEEYTVSTKFYNLPINQDSLRGGVFAGHLEIADITCEKVSE